MKNKIFVQIAAYRDLQLIPTINDLLNKADNDDQFTFGVCWQYDETENINYFDGNKRFRIKKFHHKDSQGLGWARSQTNNLYDGEELTLQLDCHHRFKQGWDTLMIEDYHNALKLSEKPILTTYLAGFQPEQSEFEPVPRLMSQYKFNEEHLLFSRSTPIIDYKTRHEIIPTRMLCGHFYLVNGLFINEVPYDPDIYFGTGTEEATMSVRAFTNGYDFYSPYRQYIWHQYNKLPIPKHFIDYQPVTKDIFSKNKTRQLFGQYNYSIDLERYGLGNKRSLNDYQKFCGIDFKNRHIDQYTLDNNPPPNPNFSIAK